MLSRSIAAFSDDGHLSVDELDHIVAAGDRNGAMRDTEKVVLIRVIQKLTSQDLNPELWRRIESLIDRYHLDEVC